MRFALNVRTHWRAIFSLANGGSLFVAGFDRPSEGGFRVTIGIKNRFGDPVWFHEWQGKIGEPLFDSGGGIEQKVATIRNRSGAKP